MVTDPICCLTVDESTERRANFNGETVYFCSEQCREIFLSTPYSEKLEKTHQRMGAHTCARHPELWQEDPCDCPKCRIALERATKPVETNGPRNSKSPEMAMQFPFAAVLLMPLIRGWRAITTV